jgi:hypothetical protein
MSKLKPALGDKTPSYPFGYGFCQCGCKKLTQLKSDGIWASYCDGHEPIQETVDTQKPSENPGGYLTDQIDPKSAASRDPVSVEAQESSKTTHQSNSSSLNNQPNTHPVRERLTKLFEFLKAYVDLRFPPVRDIVQQPRFLWLKDIPAHASVELFRDAGKPIDEAEDNDIVLRLTRPAITQCPSPPVELTDWLNPDWQELSSKAEVRRSRNVVEKDGKTLVERFEADERRPLLLRT